MRDKANGQMRLLTYDEHDNHISAKFIQYYMDNKITFILLHPHSSHFTEPLDVDIFEPLKTMLSYQLVKLISISISRLKRLNELKLIFLQARKHWVFRIFSVIFAQLDYGLLRLKKSFVTWNQLLHLCPFLKPQINNMSRSSMLYC